MSEILVLRNFKTKTLARIGARKSVSLPGIRPEVSDQAPTLYAVWGGGATPAQALHMVGLILPPKATS